MRSIGKRRLEGLRVLVSGSYGNHNFGDDAILEGILRLLRSLPGINVTVVSYDPEETAARHAVRAVPGKTLWQVFQAVRRSDVVIHGGGGLVKDMVGRETAVAIIQFDLLLAKLLKKRSVVFLVGVGEIWTPKGRAYARRLIPLSDLVSVRDESSALRLAETGVPPALVRTGADTVFSLPVGEAGNLGENSRGDSTPVSVGINLCTWTEQGFVVPDASKFDEFLRQMAQGIDQLFRGTQVKLSLIAFQSLPQSDDRQVLQRLSDILPARFDVELIDGSRLSFADMVHLFRGLDFFVGMRYHSIVMAMTCGVPFLGVRYEQKVMDLLESVDMTSCMYHLKEEPVTAVASKLESAWRTREQTCKQIEVRVRDLRTRARSEAVELVDYLAKLSREGRRQGWLPVDPGVAPLTFRILWDHARSKIFRALRRPSAKPLLENGVR